MPEFFSPGKEGVESKKGDRFIYGHQGIGLLSPPLNTPRTCRIVLPNYPHHVIQSGHNRQTIFPCGNSMVPEIPSYFFLSVPENSTTLAILYKTTASRNNS
jgi:hypothetical protein